MDTRPPLIDRQTAHRLAHLFVAGFAGAVGIVSRDTDGNAVEGQLELALGLDEARLALPQRFFGMLAIVNVYPNTIPAGDFAGCVAMWASAALEPAIDTIGSTKPRLEPIGLAQRYRPLKDLDCLGPIFGMDGLVRRPLVQFFQPLAEVLGDLWTDDFVLALRRHEEDNDAGNTADDPECIGLALARGYACPRAPDGSFVSRFADAGLILDLDRKPAPLDYLP